MLIFGGPYLQHPFMALCISFTILDDYSRHLWVIMINNKAEVSNCVKGFINMVKTQFEKNIKFIRRDNGPEFLLKALYEENGILH